MNPHGSCEPQDFKSCASASSAIHPYSQHLLKKHITPSVRELYIFFNKLSKKIAKQFSVMGLLDYRGISLNYKTKNNNSIIFSIILNALKHLLLFGVSDLILT